ncbi:MAG: hypothetical protein LBU34_15380, partial [Planctomycetaceae bacterium]|nr:hypothetical protein [Planctomycetaceae bacterium]
RYLLAFVKQHVSLIPLNTNSVKPSKKNTLSFLFVYSLPLLIQDKFNTPLVGIAVFITFLLVYGCNTFSYNPVLNLFGFYFYEVTSDENIPYVLITRDEILQSHSPLWVKQIGHHIFIKFYDDKY